MAKYPENWINKLEIDINSGQDPKAESEDVKNANWALLAEGITQITPASNETSETNNYYADKGFGSTDITSKRASFAISGVRVLNDPAQDYVAARFFSAGDSVKTLARWTGQYGDVMTANVTLSAIIPFNGNSNAKQTFSFTMSVNGAPVLSTKGTNNDLGDGMNGEVSGAAANENLILPSGRKTADSGTTGGSGTPQEQAQTPTQHS